MTEKKKVLILTADAGFGHRSAANAIQAALQETHGEACQVEIINPLDDERTPSILSDSQNDYDRLVREMPEVYRLRYQISDAAVPSAILESAVTVMLYRILQDILSSHAPDAVVATHPLYPGPLNAVISNSKTNTPFITVVTDLGPVHRLWFNSGAELVLAPTSAAQQAALEAGLKPDQVQVTGIPVNPELVRPADKLELRASLGWDPTMTTALVAGSKRVKNLPDVLNVINHAGHPLQLAIVAGGDDELYAALQETEWHHPVHLYNFVTNMPDLMRASDLLFCKAGGLITTEALACGLPMLIFDVTPGQEEGNADYVLKNRAGELALDPLSILETLSHWLVNERAGLLLAAENARQAGRPRAAFTAADFIWSAAQHGPRPFPPERQSFLVRLRETLSAFGIAGETS